MSYQVLARKWRPKNFTEIVEQKHVTQALINALDQNRLHHAYLFAGTRGVGKTTLARILAKCLNCEQGVSSRPCGKCSSCLEIDAGHFIDLIEVDAASRTKVEDTRELLDNVQYAPTRGRYKVYLIDEVHMLSGHSFNALLKTLEEPPEHVKFLLATTDPQKLPITVLSRCLQFNLKNIQPEQIANHLAEILQQEQIAFEEPALHQIANAADGSIRDGLSLLDQAIAYTNGNITNSDVNTMLGTIEEIDLFELLKALAQNDGNNIIIITMNLSQQAADFNSVLEGLLSLLHHLALLKQLPKSYQTSWGNKDALQELAALFTPEEIQLYYQIALIGRRDLPLAPTTKSGFEMVMLRMLAFTPTSIKKDVTNTVSQPSVIREAPSAVSTATQPPATKISDNQDWSSIYPQLNLTGPTKALAANCSLQKIHGNTYQLLLSAKHAPMLNKKHEERISKALTEFLQKPTRAIIATVAATIESPAAITKQAQRQKQQAAEQTINSDDNVQKLLHEFNATIIPGSIINNEKR